MRHSDNNGKLKKLSETRMGVCPRRIAMRS